ncbi:LamG-like jellyroll fold domain-containing protein [Flagellimonas flava]|uniref:Concanavalin A-like lectin/glucanases superfamily protein n=1 Tax=Flagellimonas flava TaxID=570519 RepID=A0A1M5I0R7_9FLAO|nr:LamG-like jellyroll fold domain-containing protein [Allomuricauda flava]SHG21599.1 Concanavalin A-like lectin/glucanases superfamily protein [Allomuricauda flava]
MMRTTKILAQSLLAILLFYSCDQGIDGLTQVDPGADASAPQVTINYPLEGTTIKVLEAVTSITVDFEVTDDIEVASIQASIDGNQIAAMSDFLDYRRVLVDNVTYDNLADGNHTFNVSATDLDGKNTSVTVNFVKEPAYVPLYAGEVLYMPFDGDYFDLVGLRPANQVGSPGFNGEGFVGLDSYAGASNSHLELASEGMLSDEFSAVFWYKVNADPDRAGVLVIGPPDTENAGFPETQNLRTNGFRFFRENAGGEQRFKLNVGTGAGEAWFDGGDAADLPADAGWSHMAFTISQSRATVYINGEIVSQGDFAGVDWTNCDLVSIMSGAPRFTGWGHLSDLSNMDELRMFNRELSQNEIQSIMATEAGGFVGSFEGEMFYMPFDGDLTEKFLDIDASTVGTTGFAGESVAGSDAYAGAADSYLTFPTNGLTTEEFSATMWYKINADPDRAGILVMGPPDMERAEYPDIQNLRTNGFRFFREAGGDGQIFKLNVGRGDGDSWFDGGATASIPSDTADWVHLAFTISNSECVVYIDGEVVAQGDFTGVDWTGCDILSIGSGAPRFNQWNHLSDLSYLDELRLFSKALSQSEVQSVMNFDQ